MIAVGDGRPYPPTGLTTAGWMAIPPSWVDVDELTTTQTHAGIAAVLHEGPRLPDPLPNVVAHRGRLYLEDGHGAVTRLALLGFARVLVRVCVIP